MPNKMETYSAAKIRELDEQATFRVYGRPLDFDLGDAARRWKPVFPCDCVQDSPENPCQCPPWVWWIRSDMILAEGDADRKDHEGNELRYFDVLVESKIVIESVHSVSAGALKSLGRKPRPDAIGGVAETKAGKPVLGTIALEPLSSFLIGVASGLVANAIWDELRKPAPPLTPEQMDLVCKRWPHWCS